METFFNINEQATKVTSSTGDFSAFVSSQELVTDAGDIDINSPVGNPLYEAGGFTFTTIALIEDTFMGLSCASGGCLDSRRLTFTGTIFGNGYEATPAIALWTANGSCLGSSGSCTSNYSASWSSSVVAVSQVPIPAAGILFMTAITGLFGWKRLSNKPSSSPVNCN